MPSLSWKPPSKLPRNAVPMPIGGAPNFGLQSSRCPGGVNGSAGDVPYIAPYAAPAGVVALVAALTKRAPPRGQGSPSRLSCESAGCATGHTGGAADCSQI